jgi:hypothetical protein
MFFIGVGQYFLQLRGVQRQDCCGNTHLDDMQDYVVKMGPDSVLPTLQCRTSWSKPVMQMENWCTTNAAHVTFSYKNSFKIATLVLGYNGGIWSQIRILQVL